MGWGCTIWRYRFRNALVRALCLGAIFLAKAPKRASATNFSRVLSETCCLVLLREHGFRHVPRVGIVCRELLRHRGPWRRGPRRRGWGASWGCPEREGSALKKKLAPTRAGIALGGGVAFEVRWGGREWEPPATKKLSPTKACSRPIFQKISMAAKNFS